MKIESDLVRKFLRNQCTKEEAEIVQAYFDAYPGKLEQYISLNDWLADNGEQLSPAVSERILQRIRGNYDNKKPVSITRLAVRYAVAASLTGIIILGGIQLFTGKERTIREQAVAAIENKDSAQALRTIENNTGQAMHVDLSDGSAVIIHPNSSLQYIPAFSNNKRELFLNGSAIFEVSKDTSRPFTVYAMGIATTALGTRFELNANVDGNVRIVLFEGKVMVRSQKNYSSENNKPVYLIAGDQIEIAAGFQCKVSGIVDSASRPANNVHARNSNARKASAENKLSFRNTDLLKVFDELQRKFDVHISYPDKR